MHTTINPRRFLGQEIVLSPLARGQSAVILAGLRIGRISHVPNPEGRESWLWTLTGPHCDSIPAFAPMLGETASLSEAKLKLRAAFDAWLRWAMEQGDTVHWHWTEAAPAATPPKTDVPDRRRRAVAL